MATIKVKIYILELSNVIAHGFDQIKVYRSDTTDEGGAYSEITDAGTRIDILAGVPNYEYIDGLAPSVDYWYATKYYNSSTTDESAFSDAIQGTDIGLYVSLQDIRAEGFTVSDIADDRSIILSLGWQNWFIDRVGQWFSPKQLELDFDGNGSRVLWLDVPIITIDYLYINDDFTNAVDSSHYTVYNRFHPDDRKNPRIKLKKQQRDIFMSSSGYTFETGDLNQRVVGSFGYVDEDGSVPFLVKRAIMSLIALTAELKSDSEIDELRRGRTIEEVTDRHRIRFSDLWDEIQAWKPTGITDVDEALAIYRRPATVTMARSFIV